MQQQSWIGIFALSAAYALGPAAATAQTHIVSSEVMDMFEAWTDPKVSLESYALDFRPDLIEAYVSVAEAYHSPQTLDLVFPEQLPLVWAEIQTAMGSQTPSAANLIAWAMAGGSQEYLDWQNQLASSGDDFATFVANGFPQVLVDVADLDLSPAKKGISLLAYAGNWGAAAVEAVQNLPTQFNTNACSCWTVVSFDDLPGPGWHVQGYENQPPLGWIPNSQFQHSRAARGAVRDIDFHRRSRFMLSEKKRERFDNWSNMRVHMSCTDASFAACQQANACTGQLIPRIGYASRVEESHTVSGPWARDVETLVADLATLEYQAPAPQPPHRHVKGIAVTGGFPSTSPSLANLLGGFYDPYVQDLWTHEENSAYHNVLMTSPFQVEMAGVYVRESEQYSFARSMRFESTFPGPTLVPGETHKFSLWVRSLLYGRGYGAQSDSRGHLDSAALLVATGRNYYCQPGVTPPVERVYWNYDASTDAPVDIPWLQQEILGFASSTLGVTPPNVASSVPGHYP